LFIANLRLARSFSFGPVIPDETPPPADTKDTKADTKKDAKTPAKQVKKEIERKYNLGFGVSSNNIFNHVNLGPPVGVLGSPLFGTSNSLATIFGSGASNRTVNVETFFRF
jgi:hypothetical protein